jgi:hypothetical protein
MGYGFNIANRATNQYRYIREQILKRDCYKCVQCGRTDHLHMHHTAAPAGNPYVPPECLITLCNSCHVRLPHNKLIKSTPKPHGYITSEIWDAAKRLAHTQGKTICQWAAEAMREKYITDLQQEIQDAAT